MITPPASPFLPGFGIPLAHFASLPSFFLGFPDNSDGKESACSAGDSGSIPGLGRSPEEGNGNPLQYSCLQNPMDGGNRQVTVHGVAESWTQLSDFTSLHFAQTPWWVV